MLDKNIFLSRQNKNNFLEIGVYSFTFLKCCLYCVKYKKQTYLQILDTFLKIYLLQLQKPSSWTRSSAERSRTPSPSGLPGGSLCQSSRWTFTHAKLSFELRPACARCGQISPLSSPSGGGPLSCRKEPLWSMALGFLPPPKLKMEERCPPVLKHSGKICQFCSGHQSLLYVVH